MGRPYRRLTAWIACIAILLAALAPTLAQALTAGAERATPWSEICSAAGTQPGAESLPGSDGQSSHGIKHCPWCAGSNHQFALPSAHYALPPAIARQATPADLQVHSPTGLKRRGIPQPRAPPIRS
jgi:hypothetical protein